MIAAYIRLIYTCFSVGIKSRKKDRTLNLGRSYLGYIVYAVKLTSVYRKRRTSIIFIAFNVRAHH